MFDYNFVRMIEFWGSVYAAIGQVACMIVTWRRLTLGEAWRYVGAAMFLGAFAFGVVQVIHQHIPPGTRIFYLTPPLLFIDMGLTYTFVTTIRSRIRKRR